MRHESAPQPKQVRTKEDANLIKDMATLNMVTNSVEFGSRNKQSFFAKT